jgi:4-amino-4-deoxy-L-arabinose transferase-like glycosyltransferase
MTGSIERFAARLGAPLVITAGAVLLRVISGVGFVNYDTLYALAWGGQLARGETPAYGVSDASTPHPLVELLGAVLSAFGPHTVTRITLALGFLALSSCGWVIYRLGTQWFGRSAGVLAGLIFLTRLPVLSYGVRVWIDVPYTLLVLCALLVEARRRRAGWPVLALLAVAGLLRPEAWAFSGLYWLYMIDWLPSSVIARVDPRQARDSARAPTRRELITLTLLAAAAPLSWLLSDLAITGQLLWSLTHTQRDAETFHRHTGIADVPKYIPLAFKEILTGSVLLGAAFGAVLSLLWLRRQALPGAIAGVIAVLVFAAFASVGLPILTRYAYLTAAILCVFCGAGVFGWTNMPSGDPRRRWWMAASAIVALMLIAFVPKQYRSLNSEFTDLAREQSAENSMVALVRSGAINLRCGPVGVPGYAPVPLLALYLRTDPWNVVSAEIRTITHGTYVDPASKKVEEDYRLYLHEPHPAAKVPVGFAEAHANDSWRIFEHCADTHTG